MLVQCGTPCHLQEAAQAAAQSRQRPTCTRYRLAWNRIFGIFEQLLQQMLSHKYCRKMLKLKLAPEMMTPTLRVLAKLPQPARGTRIQLRRKRHGFRQTTKPLTQQQVSEPLRRLKQKTRCLLGSWPWKLKCHDCAKERHLQQVRVQCLQSQALKARDDRKREEVP